MSLFQYQLATVSTGSAQSWYLQSSYRPEIASYAALPQVAAAYGLTAIGTYLDRGGPPALTDAGWQKPAAWGRVFGQTTRTRSGDAIDSGANATLWGFESGVDLLRSVWGEGQQDIVGVSAGYGRATADASSKVGSAGSLSFDAPFVGASITHVGPGGWYLDGRLQYAWLDDASASTNADAGLSTSGHALTASLEAAAPFDMGGTTIAPQAQIIHQNVALSAANDGVASISFPDFSTWTARFGVLAERTSTLSETALLKPWIRANLWHGFGGDSAVSSGGESLETSSNGTWAEVQGGVTLTSAADVWRLYGSGGYQFGLGSTTLNGWSGNLGVTYRW